MFLRQLANTWFDFTNSRARVCFLHAAGEGIQRKIVVVKELA